MASDRGLPWHRDRVIALGNHQLEAIPAQDGKRQANCFQHDLTLAEPGDMLIPVMQTLHRFVPTTCTQGRRVLRADHADFDLPEPLAATIEMGVIARAPSQFPAH